MRTINTFAALALLAVVSPLAAAPPAEPFLQRLPPGVFVKKSTLAGPETNRRISANLGGTVERLSNSNLLVQGRAIQVNGITASDEANAKAIHKSLQRIKKHPFCLRKGKLVVEYVGRNIDEALALKTSFELGFIDKPAEARYRVVADLATVDKADYMACNPLFNEFLRHQQNGSQQTAAKIEQLASRFTFGKTLRLRSPKLSKAKYQFTPRQSGVKQDTSTDQVSFASTRERQGVSFVTATIEVAANKTGLTPAKGTPGAAMTAATPRWPADDPELVKLARQITAGCTTNEAKSDAVLRWLAPGKNIRYSGQTGSRWGTPKVFQQKFGHCWDFADCYVTLCRAAGVPSRQVAGWLYGSSGHVWAEYYREGKGWQQVDPTGGGTFRCEIYHIPYFTTDDGEMPILYLSMPKIELLTN